VAVIAGLVLAGGRSVRFGADKALAEFGGRSLLDAVLAVLAQGCPTVAVNASGGGPIAVAARANGLAVVPDPPGAPEGPLAGVLAGLRWARGLGADRLATAPCDTPFLPADLVARLSAALDPDQAVAVAEAPDGLHPLCGVWRTSLADPLADLLSNGAHPPVRQALDRFGAARVAFPDARAFFNVNTQEDLARARPLI
jgi:molybdopterin-guanine dinucleotide biosynthesis protein A